MEFFPREEESNRNFAVTQLNGCYAGEKEEKGKEGGEHYLHNDRFP